MQAGPVVEVIQGDGVSSLGAAPLTEIRPEGPQHSRDLDQATELPLIDRLIVRGSAGTLTSIGTTDLAADHGNQPF
jgi:hypothetical protein